MYPNLAKAYPANKLPDLRGEFIRGWDDERGIDPGRQLLEWQKGTLVGGRDDNDAAVDISYMSNGNSIDYGGDKTFSTNYRSDYLWYAILGNVTGRAKAALSGSFFNVTRPRNIAFNYIVRATVVGIETLVWGKALHCPLVYLFRGRQQHCQRDG